MKKKIIYIISNIDKALAFEWIAEKLNKEKFELSFILLNDGNSKLESYLLEKGISVTRIYLNGKKSWPLVFFQLFSFFKKYKPDIIHCHLLDACILGLLAGKLGGIKVRIYTRHHSSLHHVYHRKGVFWDKLCNYLATDIIAITEKVKEILTDWEKAKPKKITLIPHGFLLNHFYRVEQDRINAFRERHQLVNQTPVIGVISRFTEWKGVQYIIPAFTKLLSNYPEAILLLLNPKGDYEKEIYKLLAQLPKKNYKLIPFETDIAATYHAMDIFVHVPIDEHSEAFGQIYIEALAAGVPSVFTRSGIANDGIFNDEVAIMVDHQNSDQIFKGMTQILIDKKSTVKRIENAKKMIKQFNLSLFMERLEKLYIVD